MYFQLGPIRHTVEPTYSDVLRVVRLRRTEPPPGFSSSTTGSPGARGSIHELWATLLMDPARQERITEDIQTCLREGRSPLVLADRTTYLQALDGRLQALAPDVARYYLDGKVGKKARAAILSAINRHHEDGTGFVLFATASLVGEGLDIPQLDTLFLTMPLSFKGRLVQYAGRIHRAHARKSEVVIYDYLDDWHPLAQAMYRRRTGAYRQMGYTIETEPAAAASEWAPFA